MRVIQLSATARADGRLHLDFPAETGDERTCGSTAALTGISHARSTGDTAALGYGIRRLLLAYGIAASFGMPLIYMGDELALGDDVSYLADPTRADDSRWRQRPPMDPGPA